MAKKATKPKLTTLPLSFCSLDFETAYSQRFSVCSVGLVKYIDGEIADSYYSLIQPPWDAIPEWSQNNAYIHKIYDRELLDQKYWPTILREMEEFCGDLPILAHNAAFEKSCIKACNEHYGLTTTLHYEDMWDTLVLTKQIEPLFGITLKGRGTRTLNTLCLMYGCPMDGTHHNALDDSIAAGNLLVLFNKFINMTDEELKSVHIEIPEPIIEYHQPLGTVPMSILLEDIN